MLTGKAGMAQEAGSAQSACSDTGLDDQMAEGSIMSAMLDAEGNKSVAVPASGGIGAVMSTGGPHSDARRLQQDVAAMDEASVAAGFQHVPMSQETNHTIDHMQEKQVRW